MDEKIKHKKSKTKAQPLSSAHNFTVVGIGASAGGLDAFKSLIKAIPENSGMAYMLVQHLDPAHESILPEILQRVTKIPVLEITNDIHLEPDHIYVIPPNKMLISVDGVLKLTDRAKKINLSIDIFFTSLADVHKEFAVGVVLSGTGSDGTLGLKAIKEHGGISIAQNTESAAYDTMPQSAINAGVVDFILAPEKIPEQLAHINSTYSSTHVFKEEEEELPKDDEAVFKQILSLLRQRTGVDFTYYKQPTFHRRIARRIAITKKKNLADYLKFLRTDKSEQDALFQDVLIPVTSFFRDPKTFEFLCSKIIPTLFKNKSNNEPIRIWVAGCSTGEEAYSIAICLHEYLTLTKREGMKVQLFASDISETAIKKARHGIFDKAEVEKLSPERIKNYFTKSNGGYEVTKHIRDLCVFAPHNFLKDPPFAKIDLISCRNVLIYMDSFLQKKALTTFHYALKENGFLILGKSESTNNVPELFAAADKHEKIYSRKQQPGRFMHVATERKEEALAIKSQKAAKQEANQTDFRKSAEQMLLSKFTPASVVINEQMDIVHIHGIITPFLEAPQGKPTFNLLKMAKEGLAFELRNALHKAKLREVAVTKENIPMKIDGNQFLVNIEIVPLTDTVDIHYLILFTKTGLPAAEEKTKTTSSRKLVDAQKQNEQLAKELANTREDMRSVTEDMEATNEELQSANEELQSSNEEMQSLNEEMETSKEELQSTNEELNIVNKEMLDKQEQLNAARLYSEAIVTTIRHPLIILDRALRIKTANAAFYKNFGTNEEETEDKLFYEIQTHRWNDQLMRTLLENILPKKETIVDLELIIKFPGLGERHLLMNARQIKNEKTAEHLILLAIEDVTEQVVARKQLEASEKRFSNILEQSIMAISIFKGREMRIAFMNEPMIVMYGKGRDVIGKTLLEVLPEMKDQPFPKLLDDVYTTGVPYYGYEMPGTLVRNGRAEKTYFNFVYQPYREVDNSITGITVIGTEVGVQVHAKKQIEASEAKFRTLSENIPHMIWTATADGKKNFFNQFFLEYTGKNFEELSGGFHKIIFPDDLEKDLQLWHHSLKTGEDFNMEKRIRHHDGTYRWHISHGAAQKDEHGNIMGWIGSNTDIDEQKKFANDLMEAKVFAEMATLIAEDEKAKAEIALQSKQQFLSNMSHEIRTPMNAIIGFTKVLLKTDLTEKQKEYLQAIKSSGNTLIVLINDILDLAKVNAGKMIFVNLPFKISESMTIILNLFETQIQEKNLELVKEYDFKIPKILLGDSVRLHQILINLLSNAIKFTSKGKIVVSVNMLNQDEEKVTLEIKVTDTGIGIPKNKIDAIFENFEQAHIITSNLYGGTGLGLAIVKQLVEKQGGTISIKSKVGEGSTFSFTLGFQKTNADPDSYRKENEAGQYETEIKPLKVLVVEDVKLNQLLMRTLLDDFKFAWDIADNGKIAIEKLQTSSYDIILMDLQMPVMNGFEATEHIRNKMNLQTPIIALTADVTTVDLEKCKAVGMNDYISKPIDEEQLYSKILELIKF